MVVNYQLPTAPPARVWGKCSGSASRGVRAGCISRHRCGWHRLHRLPAQLERTVRPDSRLDRDPACRARTLRDRPQRQQHPIGWYARHDLPDRQFCPRSQGASARGAGTAIGRPGFGAFGSQFSLAKDTRMRPLGPTRRPRLRWCEGEEEAQWNCTSAMFALAVAVPDRRVRCAASWLAPACASIA
jgi:hypothetical protein